MEQIKAMIEQVNSQFNYLKMISGSSTQNGNMGNPHNLS